MVHLIFLEIIEKTRTIGDNIIWYISWTLTDDINYDVSNSARWPFKLVCISLINGLILHDSATSTTFIIRNVTTRFLAKVMGN